MPRAQTDGPAAGIKEGKPEAVLSAKPEGESQAPAAPDRIRLRLINPHKLIAETLERDEQEAKLRKQGMPIWSKADSPSSPADRSIGEGGTKLGRYGHPTEPFKRGIGRESLAGRRRSGRWPFRPERRRRVRYQR